MKMQRRLYQLGVGTGLVTMVLGALMAIAPVAGAEHNEGHDRNPPGNNGTVKIDGVLPVDGPGHGPGPNDPGQHPDNDPHVECLFELEFFGFDTDQEAEITFTSHAPTDEGRDPLIPVERRVISDDSAGPADGENPDRDEVLPYDLSEALADIKPHQVHGWHVKLALTLYNADGSAVPGGKKHKVFWVEDCRPTGSISVEKDVTGDAAPATGEAGEPEYAFTVACLNQGETVDMTPGDDSGTTASFSLTDGEVRSFSDLPEGAECTITETDARGATTTTMTVGETVLDDDASTADPDGTVTVSSTNTAVVVTNDYPAATSPETGTVSVDKRVTGGAPSPEQAYAFTVSCDDDGVPVDLNGEGAGDDVSFTLTPSADPWMSIEIPEGAVCTITETDARGARTTTMTVGETVLDDDASTADPDGTVTVSSTNTAVVVTNDYPTADVSPSPTEQSYSVDVDKLNDADGDGDFSDDETADGAGDDVRFQITITNTGTGSLVLGRLTDRVPGRGTIDLLGDDVDLVCTTGVVDLQVGSVLPAGSTTVCTFVLDDYAPRAGNSLTNVVTIVTDRDSDTDDSTVDTETETETIVLPTPPVENTKPGGGAPPAVAPVGGTPPVLTPPAVVTPALAPAPAPAPAEVKGDVVTRALPRTGGETGGLTGLGAFLIAVGAAMVLGSRRPLARR